MPGPKRLIDYLIQSNPDITLQKLSQPEGHFSAPQLAENASNNTTRPTPKSYTSHDRYPTPGKIQKWSEFNFRTISACFNRRINDFLEQQIDDLHNFSYVPATSLKIYHERSLEALLLKTTHSTVQEALEKTSQELLSQTVRMVPGGRGCPAKVLYAPELAPDWAGMSDVQGSNNILPGDTKLSRNWESKDMKAIVRENGKLIDLAEVKEGEALVAPLKQLLHYCIESYMRYGYIITDKELVVFRVGPEAKSQTNEDIAYEMNKSAVMEWQAIPWENHGKDNELTVNIALWVLHILAANNGVLQWKYNKLKREGLINRDQQTRLEAELPETSARTSFQEAASDPNWSDRDHDRLFMSFGAPDPSTSFRSNVSRSSTKSVKRKRQKRNVAPRKAKKSRT